MSVRQRFAIWTVRLLLAASFFLGSEILLWTGLPATPINWAVCVIGYIALATLMLDLAMRFRIRDVYDLMTLTTIYALLNGLLITPQVAFADFPLTLMTRVVGGHNVVGIQTFGLFLVLIAARDRRRYQLYVLLFAAWLGFYWGIWMRWQPDLNAFFPAVSLETMFLSAGVAMLVVYALYFVVSRVAINSEPHTLQLSLVELLLLILVLLLLFIWQATQDIYTLGILAAVTALVLLCLGVLWFRHDPDEPTMLDHHLPPSPIAPRWLGLAASLFFLGTIISYHLPFFSFDRLNQLFILEAYFAAAGGIWLPLIAIVIASRGIDTQLRMGILS